jgi:hypothetical protein
MTAVQNFQIQNESHSTENDRNKNLNLISRNAFLNSEKISKTDFNVPFGTKKLKENQDIDNNDNENRESDIAS